MNYSAMLRNRISATELGSRMMHNVSQNLETFLEILYGLHAKCNSPISWVNFLGRSPTLETGQESVGSAGLPLSGF